MNRRLAVLVAAAFFMENLDGTIVQTAAPAIARDFGIDPISLTRAITFYLLAVAVGVPANGWLSNRFGARRVFLLAVAVFTIASAACALSHNVGELVASRAVQGAGGAMMVPIGRFAVLRVTEKRDLLKAIAYLTWPGLAAPLVAPALGGILTDTVGWQWVFLVNLPIGFGCFLAGTVLIGGANGFRSSPFDWTGFALCALSLSALVLAMDLLTKFTILWWLVGIYLGVAVTAGISAAVWMSRSIHPLLHFAAFRIQTFRVANVGGGLYRALVSAAPLLFTLLFQVGFGWSASLSGLLLVAIFAGNLLVKPLTSPIIRCFGFRNMIVVANVAGALTLALASLFDPTTPVWAITTTLVVSGAFDRSGSARTSHCSLRISTQARPSTQIR